MSKIRTSKYLSPWFWVPVGLFLLVGFFIWRDLSYGDDILFFNPYRQEPLNTFFIIITHFGEPPAHIVLILFCFAIRKNHYAFSLILVGFLALVVSWFSKGQFDHLRPISWFGDLGRGNELVTIPGLRLNRGYTTFPSGHTLSAFSLYGVVALILAREDRAKWGLFCAILAILVGISRIFLVQHFLPDVLTGALIGLLLAQVTWWGFRWGISKG
jgi:membrane-associated phospholipid phosphatase